jgi:uncharacterized membrane protein
LATVDIYNSADPPGLKVGFAGHALEVFVTLSLLFGIAIAFATPPLRGPDESAHFLRSYGIALGNLVPSLRDPEGRKGVLLPADIFSGFDHFERARVSEKSADWRGYGPTLRAFLQNRSLATSSNPVFVPYGGSEGYAPVAYAPQAAGALVARVLGLDFLATLYLMRLFSIFATTALIAIAIAMAPRFAWAFATVGLLPASLYGRSVISADAMAVASALMVAAYWWRWCASRSPPAAIGLPLWAALGALSKPSNLAFALAAVMVPAPRSRLTLYGALPAFVLAVIWTILSGADTAGWRMVEITGEPSAAFDPLAKLAFWIGNPLHFPNALLNTIHEKHPIDLWQQLIGVLGLFDTMLWWWVYPVLTVLLACSFFNRVEMGARERRRMAAAATAILLAYGMGVLLICYLSFTPLSANSIWGVQGRYFVPALPFAAIAVGAYVNQELPERSKALIGTAMGLIGGIACVAALLRSEWLV